MKIAKNGYAVLLSLLLAACGGGGTPAGSSTVNLSGTAAKGLLAGATVQAYEVVNGELRAFGQPTLTDEQGAYSLNLPPTDNPVIVKVTATAQTTMLDENGQLVDGQFPRVPAPLGLVLRTLVPSLTSATEVHANPLTDMVVQTATSLTDPQGRTIAPTPDTIALAKQHTIELLNLGNLDPFSTKPLAGTAIQGSAEQIKLTSLMAGMVKDSLSQAATCPGDATGLTCNLPKGLQLTVDADRRATPNNLAAVTSQLKRVEEACAQVDNEFARQNQPTILQASDWGIETKGRITSTLISVQDGSQMKAFAISQGDWSSTDTSTTAVRLSGTLASKVLANPAGQSFCSPDGSDAICSLPPGFLLIPKSQQVITNEPSYLEQLASAIPKLNAISFSGGKPIFVSTPPQIKLPQPASSASTVTTSANVSGATTMLDLSSAPISVSSNALPSGGITISGTTNSTGQISSGSGSLSLSGSSLNLGSSTPVTSGGSVSISSGGLSASSLGTAPVLTSLTTNSLQASPIDWQTFNIGTSGSINFQQSSGSAIALNRVLSTDPSAISGSFTPSGQITLLAPGGISNSGTIDVKNVLSVRSSGNNCKIPVSAQLRAM